MMIKLAQLYKKIHWHQMHHIDHRFRPQTNQIKMIAIQMALVRVMMLVHHHNKLVVTMEKKRQHLVLIVVPLLCKAQYYNINIAFYLFFVLKLFAKFINFFFVYLVLPIGQFFFSYHAFTLIIHNFIGCLFLLLRILIMYIFIECGQKSFC